MSRLIDAEHLKRWILARWEKTDSRSAYPLRAIDIIDQVDREDTIDAEPVRHGKWKIKAINTFELSYGTTGYEPVYQCSECGGVEESYLRLEEPIMPEDADFPRYCPNCGAKMDEVNDEN